MHKPHKERTHGLHPNTPPSFVASCFSSASPEPLLPHFLPAPFLCLGQTRWETPLLSQSLPAEL